MSNKITNNRYISHIPIYYFWLIEFWKGQYGINAGAEIGIYHADGIVPEKEYKTTLFTAASDEELLKCSFTLCGRNGGCVQVTQTHWWRIEHHLKTRRHIVVEPGIPRLPLPRVQCAGKANAERICERAARCRIHRAGFCG